MYENRSTLIQAAIDADIVEEVQTGDTTIYYQGYLLNGDEAKCFIKRITKTVNGTATTYKTEYSDGSTRQTHNWSDRATLNYSYLL